MSAKIVIQRNIFESKKETVYIQEGKTVEECLKLCKVEAKHCVVSIDGKTCDRKKKIESGDIVIVKVIPGDLPVDAWMMVAGTALVMTALVSAAFTGGLSLTLLGLGAGLFITGYGIDNGWFVPSFDLPKTSSQERPTGADQIRGTRNKLQQGAPVPIVLGKHYIAPLMIAPPSIKAGTNYAWGKGNIIRELFTVGYGALRISDVRIGETQIFAGGWSMTYGCSRVLNYYENIGIELRYDQERMSIYPYQESTEFVNVEISHAEGGIVRSSEPSTDRVFIDLLFPTGLVRFNSDGKKKSRTVDLQIYCKPFGAPDGSYTLIGSKSVSGSKAEALRIGLEYEMSSRGQWTFKVIRVTEDSDDTKIYDKVYFEAITSQQADDNISSNAKSKIVRMALSVGAEGDWQGIIDTLSCIAESIVPVYSGVGSGAGSWGSSAVSSNPAALFLWLLRGAANSSPVEDAKIDWAKIEEWYTWCAGKGYECNGVVTSAMTLLEALRVVATTGRASPLMVDGKYSVVIDKEQDEIVQQFTQRNVSGFKAVRAFRDVPHAIKCDFVNAAVGYQVDQRIVYRDGYSLANATKFETINFKFITSSDQVYRFARYRFAEAILRPEVFTFETDWEHIVCTRGDRVKLTHDVILVGLCAGRVKELVEEEGEIVGFTGDERMPMEAGKSYTVRFRTIDGTIYKTVETVAGEYCTVTFSTPLAAGSISVGDLYSFGEAGLETIDCLVVAISPKADLKAEVSLVEYNEAIYTADTEVIPEWTSKITVPSEAMYRVASPIIIGIRSDGTVLQLQADGSFIARILVAVRDGGGAIPAEKFELRYKIKDTDHEYTTVEAPGSDVEIWISPVEELFDYEIGVRSIGTNGTFSDWVTNYHTVAGKTAPPQDISSVVATVRGIEGVEIRWAAVTDVDLDHYELRVGADWETGEELFNGLALSYLWNKQTAGTYRLMVKAADRFGNKSAVATYTDITIDAPGLVQNLTGWAVDRNVLVAWAAPSSGTFPVAYYEIWRGTEEPTELIASQGGTYINVAEADLDTYIYWVRAVDVAGNEGEYNDVEISITSAPVTGGEITPSVPVLTVSAYVGTIAVMASRQADLAGQYYYHVQVSADEVDWYEPRLDGVDWKTGVSGGFGTVGTDLFLHTNIPFGGTEDEPVGITLYYRMRRVKQGSPLVLSEWSASASATTRPIDAVDLKKGIITAAKIDVAVLNALVAQVNDSLVVSADYGWVAGDYDDPIDGDIRAYLRTGDIRIQEYKSDAWMDRISLAEESIVVGSRPEDSTWETVYYEDWSAGYADRWTNYAGQGELAVENGMLKVGNNDGNDMVWFIANQSIVYDSDYIYRIGVGLIRTAGTGAAFAGFAGRNEADTEWISRTGLNIANWQHEVAHHGYASSEYIYRYGYLSGNGTGPVVPANSESAPSVAYTGVAKVRAAFYVNDFNVSGITYVSPIIIQRKKKNSVTGYPVKIRTVLNDSELRFEGVNNDGTIRLLNKLYIDDQVLSTSGSLFVSRNAGTEHARIEIGQGRTANGYAFIDLIGDTTYTDYGLRIIRENSGANTYSYIRHRGTGALVLSADDAGLILLKTNGSERMRINSSGNVCIGTTDDGGYKLNVSGNMQVSGYGYHTKGLNPAVTYSGNGVIARSTIWNLLKDVVPNTGDKRMISGGGTIAAASASIGGRSLMTFAYIERYSSTEIRIHGVNSTQAQGKQYAIVTNASTGFVDSGEGLVFSV